MNAHAEPRPTASLFKPERDARLVASLLWTAPAFWAFSPHPTVLSLLKIMLLDCMFFILIYAFNRLTEAADKPVAAVHKVLLGGLLVAVLPCFAWLPNTVSRVAASIFLLNGLVYSLRIPRRDGGVFQMKNLYLVKPLMVAGGHSLQWIIFTGRLDAVVLLFTAWHLFDLLVMTSLLDIPDRAEDLAAGVKTFAVVHGVQRTIEIAMAFNVLCMLAGAAAVARAMSLPLLLFVLVRPIATQRRLMRLHARKIARPSNETLLRVAGLAGVALHLLRIGLL
jgi:4-hydroxybenzoate polyprenyltransferase